MYAGKQYAGKHKKLEKPTTNLPYKFGNYPSLKLPSENKVKNLHELTRKIHDFDALKLLPEVRKCLINEVKLSTVLRNQNNISETKKVKTEAELNGLIIRPTPIQTAAIKSIQGKRSPGDIAVFTLAAETGSGKTWAYLAPLLDNLKRFEQDGEKWERFKTRSSIRSVIFVPTHELVDQVEELLKRLEMPLNIFKWDLNSNFKVFKEAFGNRIDIMVTTPAKLLSLGDYDDIGSLRGILSGVRYCVVDEADTLMDKSWVSDTYKTISHMQNLETLVFASLTIPAEFNSTMNKLFPGNIPVTTPSLHRLPKLIDFRLINASLSPYKGSKIKALLQLLYAINCDNTERGYEKRVIVFVNEKENVAKVTGKLRHNYNHECYNLSGDDDPEVRKEKIQNFINPPQKTNDEEKVMKVLVCTDLLARGLNFSGIRNVILYDVPKTSVDLVHRAGRTGRMNQSGRVFMIVTDKDKSHYKGLPKVLRNGRALG